MHCCWLFCIVWFQEEINWQKEENCVVTLRPVIFHSLRLTGIFVSCSFPFVHRLTSQPWSACDGLQSLFLFYRRERERERVCSLMGAGVMLIDLAQGKLMFFSYPAVIISIELWESGKMWFCLSVLMWETIPNGLMMFSISKNSITFIWNNSW